MTVRQLATGTLLAAALLLAAAPTASAQDREFAPVNHPGPALSVDPADLAASIACDANVATADRAPVLLTPGTTVNSREDFGWNWIPALRDADVPVCTVDPVAAPQNMGDHQVRGEYVVAAIRHAYEAGGQRRISIVGHSQGGQIMRWALRFWPDTRPMVDDVVAMAPTNHGAVPVIALCVPNCAPALWQQRTGSRYIEALNSHQETFAGVSYTNIYTIVDEFVQPNLDDTGTSSLHTGDGRITNVAIQDVCPTAVSEHLAVGTYDPVAYALGLDALTHDGPADPNRVGSEVCTQPFMPGVNPLTFATDYGTAGLRVAQELALAPRVDAEPQLRCYVFADCADAVTVPTPDDDQQTSGTPRSPAEPATDDTPAPASSAPVASAAPAAAGALPATGGGSAWMLAGGLSASLGWVLRRPHPLR